MANEKLVPLHHPTNMDKGKEVVADDSLVELAAQNTQSLSVSEEAESSCFGIKKKKKKHVEHFDGDQKLCSDHSVVLQQQQQQQQQVSEYDELLGRVFNILREKNPELTGDRRRIVMIPPEVVREGTKKTVLANFMDCCISMHRQPDHVMHFLLVELGTTGSLDGLQRLVVKGRFAPNQFEAILRRYMNEYVICFGCKDTDTILSRENRLLMLRCEKCGSQRSVAAIKAGFVARVAPRNAGS